MRIILIAYTRANDDYKVTNTTFRTKKSSDRLSNVACSVNDADRYV